MKMVYAFFLLVSCTVRTGLTGRGVIVMNWKGEVCICKAHIPEIGWGAKQNHDKPLSESKFNCGISTEMPTSKHKFQVSDSFARSSRSRDSVVSIANG
jgi:hypothetical protein